MNEVQAAFGLLQLKYVDEAIARRQAIDALYRELLAGVPGVACLPERGDTVGNYAYFPIFVNDDYPLSRDALHARLREHGIWSRRYFFPLITEFPMYRGLSSARQGSLPAAAAASRSVLCLPIYPDLEMATVKRIGGLVAAPHR